MFTGIIEELGTIRTISLTKEGSNLDITAATVLEGTCLGDSIAVNGTCLDGNKIEKRWFCCVCYGRKFATNKLD